MASSTLYSDGVGCRLVGVREKRQPDGWGMSVKNIEGDHEQAGRKLRFTPRISGKTEDGRLVVGNVFSLIESKGVQLGVILEGFEEHGWVFDWVDFIQQSLDHGWKPKGTLSKIEEVLLDITGPEHTKEVVSRLKNILGP